MMSGSVSVETWGRGGEGRGGEGERGEGGRGEGGGGRGGAREIYKCSTCRYVCV